MTRAGQTVPQSDERSARFRDAMASFPSGVTLVTTSDERGRWWGFTASSFCSLSADPPLALVCLAKSAQCHPVFRSASSWVVQVVPDHHAELARRFATRGADKFSHGAFRAGRDGHPVLEDACVVLECERFAAYEGGDHTILVGEVSDCRIRDASPILYFQRSFHSLEGGARRVPEPSS